MNNMYLQRKAWGHPSHCCSQCTHVLVLRVARWPCSKGNQQWVTGLPNPSVKDRRSRPEGVEWEPIKIPQWNLSYIPKSTRCTSLLTWSRPSSYRQAIGPRNQVRNHIGNTRRCQHEHVRDQRQKSSQKQYISSQTFHWTPDDHVQKIIVEEWFKPRNLKLFDLTAQK
jgi:hypothetical protein